MHVLIATAGSRGDLQPYVALGLGLKAAGHDVTVATHGPYEAFVRTRGLGFRALAGDPHALVAGESGQRWLETGGNPIAFLLQAGILAMPLMGELMEDLRGAVSDADALLYGPIVYPAFDFAEARRIPAIMAGPVPFTPTSAFPFVVMPDWVPDWGPLNYMGQQLVYHTASLGFSPGLNRCRLAAGLWPEPLGGLWYGRQQRMPALYGFSEHVLPRPADWGAHVHVTGTWCMPSDPGWRPDPALTAFIEEGPPPVYVGFGSMVGRDPVRLSEKVFEALARARQRGIVLSGWQGLGKGDVPPHVHVVDEVPHDWLFPRMAAVVHHGGAGTTAAGLRAGVPSVVAPYFADQPFWARRVHALGVGPAPVSQVDLTAERLADAIRVAVTDTRIRERAAALGMKLRAEDGVTRAVEAFERIVRPGAAASGRGF